MKPINEHPKFDKLKKSYVDGLGIYGTEKEVPTIYKFARAGFKNGAMAAEAILTEEHDREMEGFAEWVDNTTTQVEKGIWVHDTAKTTKELLDLFRKERENG